MILTQNNKNIAEITKNIKITIDKGRMLVYNISRYKIHSDRVSVFIRKDGKQQ